eukprot:scaffold4291_cov76-Skeletonema_dohrnii-CCMP3373.AAC.3
MRHGAKIKKCSSEGCTTYAQKGGVCIRHGAKVKLCSLEGCANNVVKGGVCKRHGAKIKPCHSEGCTNHVVQGGVCRRHGAYKRLCSSEGCNNHVLRHGEKGQGHARIKLKMEEYAGGMGQRSRSRNAAVKDAPIKPCVEESFGGMVQDALFTTRPLLSDQNSRRLPQL